MWEVWIVTRQASDIYLVSVGHGMYYFTGLGIVICSHLRKRMF